MSSADNWAPYLKSFPPVDPAFAALGYALGELPPDEAGALRQAIAAAAGEKLANETREGIEAPRLKPHKLAALNQQHVFREFDEPSRAALRAALASLAAPIAKLLRSPWRVLACRSWTTAPGADAGMNAWHRDGGIPEILKIMIYSSRTGDGHGGLQMQTADTIVTFSGPPGLWVLFYSSRIEHRGIAPSLRGAIRIATEITIAPCGTFDLEPRFIGHNVRYPIAP